PRLAVITYAGLTTDKAAFTPVALVFNFLGRAGDYIADPKFYLNSQANTLYQEASFGLTKKGGWQIRWEKLQAAQSGTLFDRVGIEKRFGMPDTKSHFQIAPSFDMKNRQILLYGGFR